MQKLKFFIAESWLLVVAALGFGLSLAVISAVLAKPIEQQRINKLNRLAGQLVPQAKNFVPLEEEIKITSLQGKPQIIEAYRAMDGNDLVAWSFNVTGPGFADKIALIVAVDPEFTEMAGYNVLATNETPGFGDKIKNDFFRKQFEKAPVGGLILKKTGDPAKIDEEIIAITGATVSSEAVVDIIGHCLDQIKDKLLELQLIEDTKK